MIKNDRIFSLSEIKKIAINYDLRFLPTKYYKGDIPSDLSLKISEAKENLGDNCTGIYKILAPENSFELQAIPKDPLLFVSLKNGQFYLVHKWGNDLSAFRRMNVFLKSHTGRIFVSTLVLLIIALMIKTPNFDMTVFKFVAVILASVFFNSFPGFYDNDHTRNWDLPHKRS